MHPAGPPPPQNRSSPGPSLAQCPSPSPSLLQQQQHVIYAPITTLQACPANIHPHCVYSGVQRSSGLTGNPGALPNQVPIRHTKVTKWQPKSKLPRGQHPHHHQQTHQQYCQSLQHQQTHVQQPLAYISKPLVFFDQCQANQAPPGATPSTGSFLVASSSFAHPPYGPGDHYSSASGLALIPQPFFKPPEVTQTFCLLPERPQSAQHHQQSLNNQAQGTYYNISASNSCNYQTIKPPLHLTNVANSYGNVTFGDNPITGQAIPAGQIFQNSSMTFGPPSRDKLPMLPSVDLQTMTGSRNLTVPGDTKHQEAAASRRETVDWPLQTAREISNVFKNPDAIASPRISVSPMETSRPCSSALPKNQDEHYSDESAASFDFTIEAEKMVSALCNTVSSNELGKDETRGDNETSTPFAGGAGDNVANKTNLWFTDFCTEYGISMEENNRTTSTQTQEDRRDPHHYPEIMRKTIYWGCNEAESILNSAPHRGKSRAAWLSNISSATRTALTKSSTCFPIYSGDKTFVQDLVNAFLRITNGWLVLDNYLNKQHYPCLDDKFDRELPSRFQTWEVVTQDLLRELIKTLVSVEENIGSCGSTGPENLGFSDNPPSTSFPGDVNLYTGNDLFDSWQRQQEHSTKLNNSDRSDRDATYTLQYASQSTNPNLNSFESRLQSQKETKLRSKWTITENLSSTIDSAKLGPDVSLGSSDLGFSSGNRYRMKNASNTSSTKITSSSRHSLNAEFFKLQNKVMESIGSSSELERQRWGLKEQQYNFVFGTSRGAPSTAPSGPGPCEPIFKIRTAGSCHENAYPRRCLAHPHSTHPVNPNATGHCTNVNGSVYLVAGPESALDSTYLAGVSAADRSKPRAEPDRTGSVRIAELNERNCGSGLVLSATSVSGIKAEPVYVGKCGSDERELPPVPRTKMTLLSQIEGNTPSANRETQEMTANLSAWFASMRNAAHRTIKGPTESRKPDNTIGAKASNHPQENSRSAIDFTRALHMDPNRQLQTLQNMQAIQSQPWNAANLLNKQTTANIHRSLDEYDSSEDVRVYMKPGSYNVPKKRHHRKNTRKNENSGSSRGNVNTPRAHANRPAQNTHHYTGQKSHQLSTSVSSLIIASSVQVSATTSTTSTSIRVPFSAAAPIVPPPSSFTPQNSPRILRRVKSISDRENRQDVAWKAACASAEILLEALNVKGPGETYDSKSPNSAKEARSNCTPRSKDNCSPDRLSPYNGFEKQVNDRFCDASSYEASEDDSSSTCKCSPDRYTEAESRDTKLSKTNVKTDSWLISTLNNASIVALNAKESDPDSTIGGSINSSVNEERHEHKTVVTSTPDPMKISSQDVADSTVGVTDKTTDCFQETATNESPRDRENEDREASNLYAPSRNLSVSLIDTSAEFVGRATYSETVRRSSAKSGVLGKPENCRGRQTRCTGSSEPVVRGSIVPIPGRKCQRKSSDRASQSVHKTRKSVAKRLPKDLDEKESEEGRSNKKIAKEEVSGLSSAKPSTGKSQSKKKGESGSASGWTETKAKVSERGWSVWYSSRRKQALSSLAFNKLTTIHQTLWQMEDAKLLKHPSTHSSGSGEFIESGLEEDSRVNKSPIFLETIGYKLKNRIYHKIEHVMRDFRKIVNNSKLYHKNDADRIAKIETLSKRLEELFQEHFATSDFENAPESPRNQASRCKSPQRQKSTTSRLSSSTKKNSAPAATKNEN
ncbi:serine-rich adhesin for platelets-like [Venturia canescens]|uniref:serine-rich adhesin for platelets-like n=1 Tax=Venturia canescens TaxID=32260 RepID=UPI001C9CFA60|nr:serine-rich adhesin for platelets-like [Venturia canescens]